MSDEEGLSKEEMTVLAYIVGIQFLTPKEEAQMSLFKAINLPDEIIEQALESLKNGKYVIYVKYPGEKEERVLLHPKLQNWLIVKFSNSPN